MKENKSTVLHDLTEEQENSYAIPIAQNLLWMDFYEINQKNPVEFEGTIVQDESGQQWQITIDAAARSFILSSNQSTIKVFYCDKFIPNAPEASITKEDLRTAREVLKGLRQLYHVKLEELDTIKKIREKISL